MSKAKGFLFGFLMGLRNSVSKKSDLHFPPFDMFHIKNCHFSSFVFVPYVTLSILK